MNLLIIPGIGVLSLVTAALLGHYLLKADRRLMCRPPDFPESPCRLSRDPFGTGQQSLQAEIGIPSGQGLGTSSDRRYLIQLMRFWPRNTWAHRGRIVQTLIALTLLVATRAFAQPPEQAAGEANLKIPDLSQVQFLGVDGHKLLIVGILFCVFGLLFGLVIYSHLKNLPVHRAMKDVSQLIWETCKTYLVQQGKFLTLLWVFIAAIILVYFGVLLKYEALRVVIILLFSVVGIGGSYGVAWFGIRVNTFANSRMAFASLRGKPFPLHRIPLQAGMSVGMMLISVELLMMLVILLFVPGDYAGPCFIGFAIGESLGAAALRIAGGIFTKIADIGSDLMKIVFKIKEDDPRNPGVIADCTGDNAGDSVGPTADGFETYGVTGVALITFILLAVKDPVVQVQLLVWIFDAHHDAGGRRRSLFHQRRHRQGSVWQRGADELRSAADLARLDHLGSFHRADVLGLLAHHSQPGW
jgi:Inorganic H+ pyrophosphatase